MGLENPPLQPPLQIMTIIGLPITLLTVPKQFPLRAMLIKIGLSVYLPVRLTVCLFSKMVTAVRLLTRNLVQRLEL